MRAHLLEEEAVCLPLLRAYFKDICTVKQPASEIILSNMKLLDFWNENFNQDESTVSLDKFMRVLTVVCKLAVPLAEDEKAIAELHGAYARCLAGHLDRGPFMWTRVRRPDGETAEGYVVEAEGEDDYRHFIIPYEHVKDRFVEALDVQAGNRQTVHHVIVYVDTSGRARELDAEVHPCDASRENDVMALFARVDASLGTPSLVVYNPSRRVRGPVAELDADEVDRKSTR